MRHVVTLFLALAIGIATATSRRSSPDTLPGQQGQPVDRDFPPWGTVTFGNGGWTYDSGARPLVFWR